MKKILIATAVAAAFGMANAAEVWLLPFRRTTTASRRL